MKYITLVFISLYSITDLSAEDKLFAGYAISAQSSNSSISDDAVFKNNPEDSAFSISFGKIVQETKQVGIEFSYLGNSGFKYGDYLLFHRYITLLGLNLQRRWEYGSFGVGGGIIKTDNNITKSESSGVTVEEDLKNGKLTLPYFKIQGELHYQVTTPLELYMNFAFYNWFQDDGKIKVTDNGEEFSKTLSLIQMYRSIKIGIRYYFD